MVIAVHDGILIDCELVILLPQILSRSEYLHMSYGWSVLYLGCTPPSGNQFSTCIVGLCYRRAHILGRVNCLTSPKAGQNPRSPFNQLVGIPRSSLRGLHRWRNFIFIGPYTL
jgi:hypothetical protein